MNRTSVHAGILRPLQNRLDFCGLCLGIGVVVDDGVVESQGLVVGLDAGEHGGSGRRRIRSLSVDTIGLKNSDLIFGFLSGSEMT